MTSPVRAAPVRLALGVLTVLVAGGCGGAVPATTPSSAPPTSPAQQSRPAPPRYAIVGPLVTVSSEPGAVTATALVGGRLQRQGDCVRLDHDAVVWPEGVSWDADTSTVVSPEGQRFDMGEQVSGGGGMTGLGTLEVNDAPDDVLAAVQACLTEPGGPMGSGEVAVLHYLDPPVTAAG